MSCLAQLFKIFFLFDKKQVFPTLSTKETQFQLPYVQKFPKTKEPYGLKQSDVRKLEEIAVLKFHFWNQNFQNCWNTRKLNSQKKCDGY